MKRFFILVFVLILPVIKLCAQVERDSSSVLRPRGDYGKEISGRIISNQTQTVLPYTNIYALKTGKGSISNENGYFSIDITGLSGGDTVCFQYIGFKIKKLVISELEKDKVIGLDEEIYDLNEMLVFGNAPDPREIVKNVIRNKSRNYPAYYCTRQSFIRQRENTDIDRFHFNVKKTTIPELDEATIKSLEEKIPKNTTSYTDFLGDVYFTGNPEDTVKLKVDPVRTVTLKEKEYDDLQQFDTLFNNIFTDTVEKEFWKVRSGIFGEKIDNIDEDQQTKEDSVRGDRWNAASYSNRIRNALVYSKLNDEDYWEFLYETGRYDYTIAGGTSFKGEEVFIIDFTPRGGGHFTGRLYIAVSTFALLRADYEYAPGKIGRDIHLLGIGYTENSYSGSIYFEKKDSIYALKYFSNKQGFTATVDRDVEISKKKKRALFPKELMTLKLGLEVAIRTESSIEYYVLDEKKSDAGLYSGFTMPKYMDIIYVDQFDDSLWDGYSIIEPTRRMREYRKQDSQ